jgi:hypothetical protein
MSPHRPEVHDVPPLPAPPARRRAAARGARRGLSATVAVLAATGLIASGGDDGDDATTSTATQGATSTQATTPATTTQAGPATAESFKAAYQPLRTRLNAVSDDLAAALQAADQKTNAQIATQFAALRTSFDAEIDKLDALRPPAELREDFDTIRTTSRAIGSDLGKIADAGRTGDAAAAKAATQALVGRIPTLREAATSLSSALDLPRSGGSTTTTAP